METLKTTEIYNLIRVLVCTALCLIFMTYVYGRTTDIWHRNVVYQRSINWKGKKAGQTKRFMIV